MHNPVALCHRQPSVSGVLRYFATETPLQGSKKVFHPCADGMFQHGFGSSLAVVGFLNALLGLEGSNAITSVENLSRELPSEDTLPRAGYAFTVDLRCSSSDGRHFLVEIQNDFRPHYHIKALVEHSRMISMLDLLRLKRLAQGTNSTASDNHTKEFWRKIEGVYTIVVTNKVPSHATMKNIYPKEPVMEPCLLNRYELRHTIDLNRHFGDKPSQIILFTVNNLKNLPAAELLTPVEQWAYVFQDSMLKSGSAKIPETKTIEGVDHLISKNPGIKAFLDRISVGAVPSDVYVQYMREISYYNEGVLGIHEAALETGKEEGIQIGMQRMRSEIVLSLKQSGMPIDDIARNVGITSAEVNQLISTSKVHTKVE